MNRLKHILIFLLLLITVSGCAISGRSGVPNLIWTADRSSEPGNYSYIVLGASLTENNDVKSYLYSLIYDGHLSGLQGIAKEGAAQYSSFHHHYSYIRTDNNNHAFLVWKVPVVRGSDNTALLYPAVIGNNKKSFFFFDYWKDVALMSQPKATGFFPFIGTLTREGKSYINSYVGSSEKPPLSSFEGNVVTVEANRIYYLGETTVSADMVSKKDDATIIANVTSSISSDEASAKKLASTLNLPDYKIIDMSDSWKKFPIGVYYNHSRKHMKKD